MKPEIAIVYDRVNVAHGGAEQVLLALHQLFPTATLFTSIYDQKEALWAKSFDVKTSFLQKLPFVKRMHRYLAILMPLAFEFLDLSTYDIVISVTSAEAKGVITRRDQLHLCYLLSPPRYLYHYQKEYLRSNKLISLFFVQPFAEAALNYLKKWDQTAIFRPDLVVPIAAAVQNRAQKYYSKLELAPPIYPPINTDLLKAVTSAELKKSTQDYFLLVARLVPYKNVDAAILACQKLGLKLIIVGEGPDRERLQKLVRTKLISFRHKLTQVELAELYQNCQAVLSPGLDDFSITALEANLFGKPVIINQLAGAAEIIKHRRHGLHLSYAEGDRLKKITDNLVDSLQLLPRVQFDPQQLQKNALKYDTNRFALNFDRTLRQAYQAKREGKL